MTHRERISHAARAYRGLSPWLKVRVVFGGFAFLLAGLTYINHTFRHTDALERADLIGMGLWLVVGLAALFGDGLKGIAELTKAYRGDPTPEPPNISDGCA